MRVHCIQIRSSAYACIFSRSESRLPKVMVLTELIFVFFKYRLQCFIFHCDYNFQFPLPFLIRLWGKKSMYYSHASCIWFFFRYIKKWRHQHNIFHWPTKYSSFSFSQKGGLKLMKSINMYPRVLIMQPTLYFSRSFVFITIEIEHHIMRC